MVGLHVNNPLMESIRSKERTFGDKLHLGRTERIVVRNDDINFKYSARIGSIVRTL